MDEVVRGSGVNRWLLFDFPPVDIAALVLLAGTTGCRLGPRETGRIGIGSRPDLGDTAANVICHALGSCPSPWSKALRQRRGHYRIDDRDTLSQDKTNRTEGPFEDNKFILTYKYVS